MTPEFHPAAQTELAAAVKIGNDRSPLLGRELMDEVRRVITLLCDMPQIGERLDERHRRFPLDRFPFGIGERMNPPSTGSWWRRPYALEYSFSACQSRALRSSNYRLERAVKDKVPSICGRVPRPLNLIR